MKWDRIKGRWGQVKGEVKAQWGKLTDDDLTRIDGEREQLVGKLQAIYGKTRQEAEDEVDAFADKMGW